MKQHLLTSITGDPTDPNYLTVYLIVAALIGIIVYVVKTKNPKTQEA